MKNHVLLIIALFIAALPVFSQVSIDKPVGIGTTSPAKNLHVKSLSSEPIQIKFGNIGQDNFEWGLGREGQTTGRLGIFEFTAPATSVERVSILTGGNVGIGTVAPAKALHVKSASSEPVQIKVGNIGQDNFEWGMGREGQTTGRFGIFEFTAPATSNERLTILQGGNVGIGVVNPGAKLEVAGQVKITGGTPGAGKVLTSDAAGLASWTTLNSVAVLTYDVTSGTHDNAPAAGWNTRPLTTELADPDGIVTLASNQFTLQAGTYYIDADQVFYSDGLTQQSFRGRIRNVTANSTALVSQTCRLHIAGGESANGVCPTKGLITIASATTFSLQYFAQTGPPEWSLGHASNSGEVERYAQVVIQKVK